MLISLDGEKLKVLKGFKTDNNEVLISDCDKFGDYPEVRVVIEPSLIKYWITDCGLLEELGIDATVWPSVED